MAKAKTKAQPQASSVNSVYRVWGWVLLLWSLYRYFLKLPEWVDEFIAKPIVFLGPMLWFVTKIEKRPLSSLGLTFNNFFTGLYVGFGFGFVFALEGLAANIIKHGKLQVNPIAAFEQYGFWLIVLSVATAFTEELLSRGFIFNRVHEKTKNLAYASFISTILFVLLHIPILVTQLKFQGMILVLFFLTDFILGFANSVLYATTRTLVAPILVHVFWNMTVALYL